MHKKLNALLVATAVSCLALAACTDDDNNNGTMDAGRDGSVVTDGGTDATADAKTNDASDATPAVVNDNQIVGLVEAVNAGEVSEAQLAQTKAVNADVIAFAGRMVTEHTQSNSDLATLRQQQSLTSDTSPLQQQVQAAVQQTLTKLQGLQGAAFDSAYMQAQVEAHGQVLTLLDQLLIPAAQNAALKTFLQTTRATVAAHLQAAQALNATLSDGGAGDGGSDADASDGAEGGDQ